eukprot:EG_transcript_6811
MLADAAAASAAVQRVAAGMGLGAVDGAAAQLLARDAEYRLREVVQEAMKFMKRTGRTHLVEQDVQLALSLKGVALGGGSCRRTGAAFPDGQTVVRLDDVLQAPVTPSYVPSPTVSCHWLAVNGVQPAIPANPPATLAFDGLAFSPPPHKSNDPSTATLDSAAQRADAMQQRVRQSVSQEQLEYFLKITDLIVSPASDSASVARALGGLQRHCVAPLAPFLAQFFHEEVLFRLADTRVLRNLVGLLGALHRNPNVLLAPHLGVVMEPLLTCVTGSELGRPGDEDHWAVRRQAGPLLAELCLQHSDAVEDLLPRMVRTLLHTLLAPGGCLPAHYGALLALAHLGPEAIYQLFLQGSAPGEVGKAGSHGCTLLQYVRWLSSRRDEAVRQRPPPAPLLFAIAQCWEAALALAVQFLNGVCATLAEVGREAAADGTWARGKLRRLESLALPPAIASLYSALHEAFGEALLCRLTSPVSVHMTIRPTPAVLDDDAADDLPAPAPPPAGRGPGGQRRWTLILSRTAAQPQRSLSPAEGSLQPARAARRWRVKRVAPTSPAVVPETRLCTDWLADTLL